jgi:hypothetical protein
MKSNPRLCNNKLRVSQGATHQWNGSAGRGQKVPTPGGHAPATPATTETGQFGCIVTASGDSFTIEVGPRDRPADIFTVTVTLPGTNSESVPAATTITVSNVPDNRAAKAVFATELGCFTGTVAAFASAACPGGSSFVATADWGAGPDANGLRG